MPVTTPKVDDSRRRNAICILYSIASTMLRYLMELVAAIAVAQSPAPERFSVLSAGSPAGKGVQTTRPDGTIDLEYSYLVILRKSRFSAVLKIFEIRLR